METIKKLNKIRNKLKRNASIGAWLQIPSEDVAEIISNNKALDWVNIDLEHGNFNGTKLTGIIRTIEKNNKLPFVRLQNKAQKNTSNLLDLGAGGIIAPMINNKKEILNVIEKSLFPPYGKRGVGYTRSNLYGSKFSQNKKFRPLIIAMIETKEAVKNLEEIVSTKFLDGIFIGPYDLSASLGIAGKLNHPKFKRVLAKILNISKKHKIFSGIHVVEPNKQDIKEKIKQGFKFIAFSTDAIILERSSKFFFNE